MKKNQAYVWYLLAIVVVFFLLAFRNRANASVGLNFGGDVTQTPGFKNNNPLNIEYRDENNWLGQTGRNGRFATFSNAEYGIRAGAKLLRRYINEYQLTSVYAIISRWAPEFENPTTEYAEYVARRVGIDAYSEPVSETHITQLVNAMIEFEIGGNPYSPETINRSITMALT
jgi:hypothetical protein